MGTEGYELSPQQRRLWRLGGNEAAETYQASSAFLLQGPFDRLRLVRAIGALTERYEILRTVFVHRPGISYPLQVVLDEAPPVLRHVARNGHAHPDAAVRRLYDQARGRRVDLSVAPLLDVSVTSLDDERHVVLLRMPALCADHTTLARLNEEIARRYASPGAPGLEEEPIQYSELAHWQNQLLAAPETEAGRSFWRWVQPGHLGDQPAWSGGRSPAAGRFSPRVLRGELDGDTLARLQERAGAALQPWLLGAWLVLTARLLGRPDPLVGTLYDGRGHDETRVALGPLSRYLPIAGSIEPGRPFTEVVAELASRLAELAEWQDYWSWERLAGGDVRAEAFALCFELLTVQDPPSASGQSFSVLRARGCLDRFELKLSCVHDEHRLVNELHYDTRVLGRDEVKSLGARFRAVLRQLVRHPERPVGELDVLIPSERRRPLRRAGAAPASSVHRLIEEQADRTPDAVALRAGPSVLTFRQLDRRANQLAHRLRRLGVGPEDRVAILLERSFDLVVGICAVLKAGAAYLPLDPRHPRVRLAVMIEDAGVAAVLTDTQREDQLPPAGPPRLCLDREAESLAGEPIGRPTVEVAGDQLAYVIFTSGSTGRPKGTMVTHAALANYLAWCRQTYYREGGEGVLLHGSIAFDLTVTSLFLPLVTGDPLTLLPVEQELEALVATLRAGRRLRFLKLTPAHLRMLNESLTATELADVASVVVVGGEALQGEDAAPWLARPTGPRLFNEYGPTEATVGCCVHELPPGSRPAGAVAIGRPIAGLPMHVLNESLMPQPAGVIGELFIGGVGLARGYLGQPGATAAKFVPDPFSPEPGGRLYRTGDLGRVLADGCIAFAGRSDHQVKIRGYRIELGEVEAALRGHPAVGDVVVTAPVDAGGERRLVAHLVVAEGTADAELTAHLERLLPPYMVPGVFVRMERLPLTPAGKIDRHALPPPLTAAAAVAPRNTTEANLARVWSDVLGADGVGIDDNFFVLGGDSIRSIQVIGRARAFGIELTVEQIFQHPTIRQLADKVDPLAAAPAPSRPFEQLDAADRRLLPKGVEDAYPLTHLQQGMVFHREYNPGEAIYHDIVSYKVRAPIDLEVLRRCVAGSFARHPALRTSFDLTTFSLPMQLVHAGVVDPLDVHDLRGSPPEAQDAAFRAFVAAEKQRGFDVRRPPLLRMIVHLLATDSAWFSLSFHHAILDGWSDANLVTELTLRYLLGVRAQGDDAPPLRSSFADYVAVEQRASSAEEESAFWRRTLAGRSFTRLPRWAGERATARPRTVGEHEVPIAEKVSRGLVQLAQATETPLKSVLLTAHLWTLGLLSRSRSVLTCLTASGRLPVPDGDKVIGLFLNSAPLAMDLRAGSWADLVRAVFEAERAILPHCRYPISLIKTWQGGENLSDTAFYFTHYYVYNALRAFPEFAVLDGFVHEETSFTLIASFRLDVVEERVRLLLRYDTTQLLRGEIAQIGSLYRRALETMAVRPHARHEETELLSGAERQALLVDWNGTGRTHPPRASLPQRVEAQARARPDAAAVVSGAERLSFRELNERANQLAHHLRAAGVGPEVVVGICVERSPLMVIAVLATLKAGGAYLPLDPGHPGERLAYMLASSGAGLVITEQALVARLPDAGVPLIRLDADAGAIARAPAGEPAGLPHPEQLAYVLYTSGSTGRPKGVAMRTGALSNLLEWQARTSSAAAGTRTLQFASLSFDVSFQDILSTLSTGGTLVLTSDEQRLDPAALLRLIAAEGVERLFIPVVTLHQLAEAAPVEALALREIIVAGEALRISDEVRAFLRRSPGCRVINQYGPTETHVVTCWEPPPSVDDLPALPPLGRPVDNAAVYLLDGELRPVARGMLGEVFIGGLPVARGYHRAPGLTAERFLPDPLGAPGSRMYRTGDLARFDGDGALGFVGRADAQVKIRGFRVELGEIEAALAAHPAVREGVVIAREDVPGEPRLVAYVVPGTEGPPPTAEELSRFLQQRLPAYMVPGAVVALDRLPLTSSGKVDRRSLPPPGTARPAAAGAPVAPRTMVEEVLAEIFAEVLGVTAVGAHDDFFALGGQSLLATRVVSRVRRVFGVELPLRALFQEKTVAGLARHLAAAHRGGSPAPLPPLEPAAGTGDPPLSFAQDRLWVLDTFEPGSALYNVPIALRLDGALDRPALERSLQAIVDRHEVLRTSFPLRDGKPRAEVAPALALRCESAPTGERCSPDEVSCRALAEAQRPFDLARGPLVRAVLLEVGDREHVLFLTLHHIVCDGWSLAVMVRELGALYAAFTAGRPSPLPPLPIQYADFATWQRRQWEGGALDAQLGYWKERLGGTLPVLALPTDRPRPAVRSGRGASRQLELGGDLLAALRALGRQQGTTLFMTLLAGLDVLLHRHSAQADILVGTPIAGRTRTELEGLVGCFINTIVLRVDLSGAPTVAQLLERVRAVTLAAYEHQDVPFERLVEVLQPPRDPSRTPIFQAMMGLQAAILPQAELPGLALHPVEVEGTRAKFDLTVMFTESEGGLSVFCEYAADLFDGPTIDRLLGHLRVLLEGMATRPDLPVTELPLLTEQEREQVLLTWNDTATGPAETASLRERIEAQAVQAPGAVAVELEGQTLRYGELDRRANQLAHALRRRGVGPEVVVGVYMERSLELVVALLAVVKAGAAYVPLDPESPPERLAFMVADCGAAVVLTQTALASRIGGHGRQVLALEPGWSALAGEREDLPDRRAQNGADLAYVIYTSGSTGRPKAAMNQHGGLLNRLDWMQAAYRLTSADRVLQKTPFTFDVSVWEFFWPLMTGARLVLARPEGHKDPAYLTALIQRAGITTLHFVPSMLQVFLETPGVEECRTLRLVIASGEVLPRQVVERFHTRCQAELHNLYGPTEASIDVTAWHCRRDDARAPVPIGAPISNTRLYVLDRELLPVPAGVPGELHIGGLGVGRGYLRRPALTAERFIPDPFTAEPGARLYRSGDLCRWAPDGTLDYLARLDHQVKLRGHRIELGEIEAALRQHPAVHDCAVVAREDRLVAYVVPEPARGLPLVRLLRLERDGRLAGRTIGELPNGMMVVHQNRSETEFLYQEIFGEAAVHRGGFDLPAGATVFDVGANIGLFSLGVQARTKDVVVHGFEPIPPLFETLGLNMDLHGVEARLYPYGLGAEEGDVPFTFYPHDSLISGRFADPVEDAEVVKAFLRNQQEAALSEADLDQLLADRLATRTFTCRVRRLSDVIRETGVDRIDLLKIDVEKGEADVLAGIDESDFARIDQILIEVHDLDGRLARITAQLRRHGYHVTVAQNRLVPHSALHDVHATRTAVRRPAGGAPPARWSSPDRLGEELRRSLERRLPEPMVPAAWVMLEALPLTANGKVDRAALPPPGSPLERRREEGRVPPRDGLDLELIAIWEDLLGVSAIGIRDDFFALGGHSLLGARLMTRIRERLGVALPLSQLLLAPTIERLADLLRAPREPGRRSPLIALRAGGTRPPFFCVHPVGGSALVYRELAAHLGDDQPFHGLHAPALESDEPPCADLEAMAARYLEAVRAIRPRGPYHLGGWSFGGLVAWEMARRLSEAGERVAVLVLLDTRMPRASSGARLDDTHLLRLFAGEVGLALGPDPQLEEAAARAVAAGILPAGDAPSRLRRVLGVYQGHARAAAAYVPRRYHGPVRLVCPGATADPAAAWAPFLDQGAMSVHRVGGDHFTMVKAPHAKPLAELLRQLIDEG
jgi:amino acid adenylation domain-containing protein/FkbM family methyltransferase